MNVLMEVWQYILVFLMGSVPWIEIAAVIPISIVAGLNPFFVALMAFLGNLSTVYLLVIFFDKFQQWRSRRKNGQEQKSKRQTRAINIWNKYGLPGLSLLGPLLIGSHIAVFIGLVFGAKKHVTLLWMTVSLVIWTVIITLLSVFGIDLIQSIR
ncbi:small multi-drug export protein [Paenibacillus sp. FSL M8-0334]|uniref:DNA-binding protein n=1 Tax=Paenibacillus campinasensis TaxID=66347 RepID=A0ABW9T1Y7_9BACL|nr:small multi-drug export protein [Paenibacillus campinasensis]MUG65686.1 DNA-binding protein [Paenibacillus campinasensis]